MPPAGASCCPARRWHSASTSSPWRSPGSSAVIEQNRINHRQIGGYIYPITAPLDLIVRQIVFILVWIRRLRLRRLAGTCAGGTARWRDPPARLGSPPPGAGGWG